MFWNAWLNKKVNYKNEIIYDQYRDKKYEDYEERIKNLVQVYGECDLIKETSGNTSNTVFDVYKLIPNGY
jgi:RecJ-like exonuclease